MSSTSPLQSGSASRKAVPERRWQSERSQGNVGYRVTGESWGENGSCRSQDVAHGSLLVLSLDAVVRASGPKSGQVAMCIRSLRLK